MAAQSVTFSLPAGTKVTCSAELAKKLGHAEPKPVAKKAPAKSDSK